MAEEIVIHVEPHYKLDQDRDQYIKLCFSSGSGDVTMEKTIENRTQTADEVATICTSGVTTLTEVIERLVDCINRKAKAPYFKTAQELAVDNPIVAAGQFAIESDNHGIKVGNGVNKYLDLPYIVDPSIATSALES